MKKLLTLFFAFLILFGISVLLFFQFNIIWRSPSFYAVSNYRELKVPIMDMEAYKSISQSHKRPYIYSIKTEKKGEVHILGVEHITDDSNPQFEAIRSIWEETKPTAALVEGRLGFLFTIAQSPIRKYGEGGLTSYLAKRDGARLYSWEPKREDEIKILRRKYPVKQIAMFYAFRPYFSNMRHGKPENPGEKLQEYLESRTNYDGIRNLFESWKELDAVWKRDFPKLDWRNYSDENGWPDGYLHKIWNSSNLARDEHLINVIVDLVHKGNRVFVTMGSSHAPRIEKSLHEELK